MSFRILEVSDLFLYSYTGDYIEGIAVSPDDYMDRPVSWFYRLCPDPVYEILKEFFD